VEEVAKDAVKELKCVKAVTTAVPSRVDGVG